MTQIRTNLPALHFYSFNPLQARAGDGKWTHGGEAAANAGMRQKAKGEKMYSIAARHHAQQLAHEAAGALAGGHDASDHLERLGKAVTALRVQAYHSRKKGNMEDAHVRMAAAKHYAGLRKGLKMASKGKGEVPDLEAFSKSHEDAAKSEYAGIVKDRGVHADKAHILDGLKENLSDLKASKAHTPLKEASVNMAAHLANAHSALAAGDTDSALNHFQKAKEEAKNVGSGFSLDSIPKSGAGAKLHAMAGGLAGHLKDVGNSLKDSPEVAHDRMAAELGKHMRSLPGGSSERNGAERAAKLHARIAELHRGIRTGQANGTSQEQHKSLLTALGAAHTFNNDDKTKAGLENAAVALRGIKSKLDSRARTAGKKVDEGKISSNDLSDYHQGQEWNAKGEKGLGSDIPNEHSKSLALAHNALAWGHSQLAGEGAKANASAGLAADQIAKIEAGAKDTPLSAGQQKHLNFIKASHKLLVSRLPKDHGKDVGAGTEQFHTAQEKHAQSELDSKHPMDDDQRAALESVKTAHGHLASGASKLATGDRSGANDEVDKANDALDGIRKAEMHPDHVNLHRDSLAGTKALGIAIDQTPTKLPDELDSGVTKPQEKPAKGDYSTNAGDALLGAKSTKGAISTAFMHVHHAFNALSNKDHEEAVSHLSKALPFIKQVNPAHPLADDLKRHTMDAMKAAKSMKDAAKGKVEPTPPASEPKPAKAPASAKASLFTDEEKAQAKGHADAHAKVSKTLAEKGYIGKAKAHDEMSKAFSAVAAGDDDAVRTHARAARKANPIMITGDGPLKNAHDTLNQHAATLINRVGNIDPKSLNADEHNAAAKRISYDSDYQKADQKKKFRAVASAHTALASAHNALGKGDTEAAQAHLDEAKSFAKTGAGMDSNRVTQDHKDQTWDDKDAMRTGIDEVARRIAEKGGKTSEPTKAKSPKKAEGGEPTSKATPAKVEPGVAQSNSGHDLEYPQFTEGEHKSVAGEVENSQGKQHSVNYSLGTANRHIADAYAKLKTGDKDGARDSYAKAKTASYGMQHLGIPGSRTAQIADYTKKGLEKVKEAIGDPEPTPAPVTKPAPTPVAKGTKEVPVEAIDHEKTAASLLAQTKNSLDSTEGEAHSKAMSNDVAYNQTAMTHVRLARAKSYLADKTPGYKKNAKLYVQNAGTTLAKIDKSKLDASPELKAAHAMAVAEHEKLANKLGLSNSLQKPQVAQMPSDEPAKPAKAAKPIPVVDHDAAIAALNALPKPPAGMSQDWRVKKLITAHERLKDALTMKIPHNKIEAMKDVANQLKAVDHMGLKHHPDLVPHYDSAKLVLKAITKNAVAEKAKALQDKAALGDDQDDTAAGKSAHLSVIMPKSTPAHAGVHTAMSNVMKIIHKIHGVPDHIKPASVLIKSQKAGNVKSAAATYTGGDPMHPNGVITVKPTGSVHSMLSMAHEYGHFIDNKFSNPGQNKNSFASKLAVLNKGHSSNDKHMEAVMNAIAASNATNGLKALRGKGKVQVESGTPGQKINVPVSEKHLDYLLSPHEQFARAYAQYVAHKSKSPGMLAALDNMRNAETPGHAYHHTQWQDDDFKPIHDAMDKLFEARGLKKKG
jgi:hypothetical protein